MNELINSAIAHITRQAMEVNNPFATFIEEHLTSICTTEDIANKLLCESKDLKEFCKKQADEMKEKAKKGGAGLQCAGLPDAEFCARAESYYNIIGNDKNTGYEKNKEMPKKQEKQEKKIINIMDLL